MLEGLAPKTKDQLCNLIRKATDELSAEDQTILFDAIDNADQWSSHGLALALRERGFFVHKNAVGEHRKRACACAH
jgi:hypothetical protein